MKAGGRADHPVELLSAAIDRELNPAEKTALEAHLEGCAECRDLLVDFRRLDEAIASEPPPEVPAGLEERILARLPSRRGAAAPRPFWKQAMPMAAAASILMAILIWYGRPERLLLSSAPEKPAQPAPAGDLEMQFSPEDAMKKEVPVAPPPPPLGPPALHRPSGRSDATALYDKPIRSEASRSNERKGDADGWIPGSTPAPAASAAPTASVPSAKQAESAKAAEEESRQALQLDEGMADKLRSLGYIGSGKTSPAVPAPAKEKVEPAKPSPDESANEGVVPQAAPEAAASRMAEVVRNAPAVAPMKASEARPRPVGLFAAPYVVTLEGERTMRVERGAWTCSVPIAEPDAKQIAAATEEIVKTSGPAPAFDAVPTSGPVVVTATPQAREAILRLVRERYRPVLEARCGPLPR